jgi:UPF0755 protein
MSSGRPILIPAGIFMAVVLSLIGLYFFALSASQRGASVEQFTVTEGQTLAEISSELKEHKLIRSAWAFKSALFIRGSRGMIAAGGYRISGSESVWEIAGILSGKPALVWISIPEGLRKEEIAGILSDSLHWSEADKNEWIEVDTDADIDHKEGVYFPDRYLIPIDEAPAQTALRMRAHFEEQFSSYALEAARQNERWTTVLKVASLLEREAAGPSDIHLISGIIWNRLLIGMKLDIDASVQYAVGNEERGWWPRLSHADLSVDSPYNTYMHQGLPPTPIANPGIAAIEAALYPASTTCLYYLHDHQGQIHCSETYAGQKANIETYLR